MLPVPSLSIDCFISRIFGKISREEEIFQLDHRGARYRSQLKGAGAGDTGVIDRWVLSKLVTPVKPNRSLIKEDEVYVKHRVDVVISNGFWCMTEMYSGLNLYVLIDKEAVLGLASAEFIINRNIPHLTSLQYSSIMRAVGRLSKIRGHIQTRGFASSPNMAALSITSKYKMLSGYEIPVLGYGVSPS